VALAVAVSAHLDKVILEETPSDHGRDHSLAELAEEELDYQAEIVQMH
jgi:hypothetical protein